MSWVKERLVPKVMNPYRVKYGIVSGNMIYVDFTPQQKSNDGTTAYIEWYVNKRSGRLEPHFQVNNKELLVIAGQPGVLEVFLDIETNKLDIEDALSEFSGHGTRLDKTPTSDLISRDVIDDIDINTIFMCGS